VISVQGTEWHGLAEHVPTIEEHHVAPLFYTVKESPAQVTIDGEVIKLEDYKVLVADHRRVRPDLQPHQQLVPLHIPKAGYKVIQNQEVWQAMAKSLTGLGAKVSSVGTLEKGRKFFISADIGDKELKIKKALKKIKKTTRNWYIDELQPLTTHQILAGEVIEQAAKDSVVYGQGAIEVKADEIRHVDLYWDFNPETMTWKHK
jgi:hypothetical protein